jgi:hypothetical protein
MPRIYLRIRGRQIQLGSPSTLNWTVSISRGPIALVKPFSVTKLGQFGQVSPVPGPIILK